MEPFFGIHGGIIASTEPIPLIAPDTTGLNFLFDLGTGVRVTLTKHRAINAGYKLLHISKGSASIQTKQKAAGLKVASS